MLIKYNINDIRNYKVKSELYSNFISLCNKVACRNDYFDNTLEYIVKLQNENDKLEEEKEMLISDLMKLQNELNFVKSQYNKLMVDIFNKIKD